MKVSEQEVSAVAAVFVDDAVSQAEALDYVAGVRTLVRSCEPGTAEYEGYRARLNDIHTMALRLMGRKS